MALINLGNVAGTVRSENPPLEQDGTTVKKYVLWAKPIGAHVEGVAVGGKYDVRYYDYVLDSWLPFSGSRNIAYGNFQIFKGEGNTGAGLEVGDMIIGWFTANMFVKALYTNATGDGNFSNENNYKFIEKLKF